MAINFYSHFKNDLFSTFSFNYKFKNTSMF